MAKLVLTKDPSHKGYYQDADGNLYVFRFGGRPIKVDEYREDKPRENVKNDKVEIDSEKIINHKKSASLSENNKFIEEVEKEKEKNKKEIDSFVKKSKNPYAGKDLETLNEMKTLQKGLNDELSSTEHRNEDIRRSEIGKELAKENAILEGYKNNPKEDIFKNYYNKLALPAPGEEELYGYDLSEVCDNVEKYFGLKNKREALNKIVEEHLDKKVIDEVMSEEKFKELRGPLYKANQELRKHDSAEIDKLKDRYQKTRGFSDDWFTEEGRKLGMKDEDIADAIYTKKGAEAQGSTDDNIKRIIANKEKQHYERLIKEYKDAINNPKTGEWDREFMKSELPGLENKAEMFANYEAEFIKRVNRNDEVFNVKYRDSDFVENFKARGLDEAYALKDEWLKYSDDVHIYDSNGNEILEDSQKHYTSPTYEKNKINEKKAAYRERLDGADRSTLVSMIHNLGLNWNVERFTDQQLYRMLEKELNKKRI